MALFGDVGTGVYFWTIVVSVFVLIVYGGAPCPEPLLRRAIEVFGCDFLHGYGMTECAAGVTRLTPEDHRASDLAAIEQLHAHGTCLP